ncbi:MAG: hypothetical protein WDZ49_02510 [Litorilinea sp.]
MEEKSFELQAADNHVIGIAATPEIRDAILEGLVAEGYQRDADVNVLHGEEGMRVIDPDGEYSGPFGKLLRAFQKFTTGVDERTLEAMKQALLTDQYILTVDMDDNDETREEIRDEIHAIMRRNGATNIFFNAPSYIELLSGW